MGCGGRRGGITFAVEGVLNASQTVFSVTALVVGGGFALFAILSR